MELTSDVLFYFERRDEMLAANLSLYQVLRTGLKLQGAVCLEVDRLSRVVPVIRDEQE